nr:hypothetical protein [Tanacetum cinerariifolium]
MLCSPFLVFELQPRFVMNDPNITMEEYIRLQKEKALNHGETFDWQTATYGKMEYCKDEDDSFTDFETEYPALVFDDTSDTALSCKPTVSPFNYNEIDFRISFDKSDDEDYMAFPLPGESSHWQYKFPLPVKVVPNARRLEMPLLGVCTAIEEMMKKLYIWLRTSNFRRYHDLYMYGYYKNRKKIEKIRQKRTRERKEYTRARILSSKVNLGESSHWQYKFPLPVKVVPTTRRLEMPLSGVCTAIKEMMKKLPVNDRWQLH